jgi:hypothetical protein
VHEGDDDDDDNEIKMIIIKEFIPALRVSCP